MIGKLVVLVAPYPPIHYRRVLPVPPGRSTWSPPRVPPTQQQAKMLLPKEATLLMWGIDIIGLAAGGLDALSQPVPSFLVACVRNALVFSYVEHDVEIQPDPVEGFAGEVRQAMHHRLDRGAVFI